jgi:hypothetical protein
VETFPEAAGLIGDLRRRTSKGENIEQVLRQIQDEGEESGDPGITRQLLAVKYYLQGVLYDCAREWPKDSNGLTNYVELVEHLRRWAYRRTERVAYVTFNYDGLIDSALGYLAGRGPDELVSGTDERLFKVHGSVYWGREVIGETSPSVAGIHVPHQMIRRADDIEVSDTFRFMTPLENVWEGKPLVPAIAIPVDGKDAFEMPPSHKEAMLRWLPEVNMVLIIGWRGGDPHLLEAMRDAGIVGKPTMVVSSAVGCDATRAALVAGGLKPIFEAVPSGFSPFIDDRSPLNRFLGA